MCTGHNPDLIAALTRRSATIRLMIEIGQYDSQTPAQQYYTQNRCEGQHLARPALAPEHHSID